MPSVIDLDTLREMLAEAEYDVKYFGDAGLDAVKLRRQARVLKQVIAYHSGEIFPGEVAA